ncbi:DNA polymerase III subunit delta' [Jatrophihabitans lederbergiae]|uniref:DNA polymerase III subunit delta n=1 Tax=Jatrophihabitans lederbergiae TaxID=3075547 RepID=A0ABU2JBN0_9ACTN|nr:DNA polymerase III subunit delta' [Jatrophihabitans sp. DSM 44399]MDT0262161.1 DNA polymerase III subunit delta' [Jatrophihabitans sp. DSM 44399]
MTVFQALIGQDAAVAELSRAARAAADVVAQRPVQLGAMTHAWLFTGPAGSGRSVAARALAAAVQCDRAEALMAADPTAAPGCGECLSCRTVRAGSHPDVRSIVPEGLSISVNEMRAVVGMAGRRPSLGRWQVVVIEDADRLTEGAANALLKAIEEPPERTIFLLCAPSTHPDDVVVTIRSRCRVVGLRIPPPAAIAEVLIADGIDPGTASWAAQASQGHVGRARRLARDDQARERREAVLAIPARLTSLNACFEAADHLVKAAEAEAKALTDDLDVTESDELKVALGAGGTGKGATGAARGSAGVLKELEKRQRSRATRLQRDALDRALVDLASFYRDVLLVQAGSPVLAAHPDFARDTATVARSIDQAGALVRLDEVLACRTAIELNVKPKIAIEAMTAALRLP